MTRSSLVNSLVQRKKRDQSFDVYQYITKLHQQQMMYLSQKFLNIEESLEQEVQEIVQEQIMFSLEKLSLKKSSHEKVIILQIKIPGGFLSYISEIQKKILYARGKINKIKMRLVHLNRLFCL